MDLAKLEKFYQDYVNSMLQSGEINENIATFQDFVANYAENEAHKATAHTTTPANSEPKEPLTRESAASIIQRTWRRHIDVQVYKYYRDLVNFKQKGDPSLMMRCINPVEAKLMDPAAGVHVKFRLAGEKFPPNIYYKIFTHRPIQDMCANSPKDYTHGNCKRMPQRIVHNNTLQLNLPDRGPEGRSGGWYQRSENNGWRLVSDRMIAHILCDPVTWESNQKKIQDFSHDKKTRKTNAERRRKQRKVEWIRKMHSEGLLRPKNEDPETSQLVRDAANGMVETLDSSGPDAVEDWEVDELLEWTTALNFDDYLTTWKEVATSAGSDDHINAKTQLYMLSDEDPYTLTISHPAHSLPQSSRQVTTVPRSGISHNTPMSSVVGTFVQKT